MVLSLEASRPVCAIAEAPKLSKWQAIRGERPITVPFLLIVGVVLLM